VQTGAAAAIDRLKRCVVAHAGPREHGGLDAAAAGMVPAIRSV
jgi:hypothetical protein